MTLKTYLHIFSKHKLSLLTIFILASVSTFLGIATIHLNGLFIDTLLVAQSLEHMHRVLFLFTGSVLSGLVLHFVKLLLVPQTKEKLIYALKYSLLPRPPQSVTSETEAYLAKRIDQDSRAIVDFVMNNYSSLPLRLIELGVVGFLLLRISQTLSLLLFGVVLVYAGIYRLFSKPIVAKSTHVQESSAQFFSLYSSQLTAPDTPKLELGFADYLRSYRAYILINTGFSSLKGLVSGGVNIVVFVLGSLWVIEGQVSIGELTVLMMYFNQMLGNVGYYLELGRKWGMTKASVQRMDELVRPYQKCQ